MILGVAVLLDAFLVRLLLIPVLLRLAGPAAWYLPSWLGRFLPDAHFRGEATPAQSPALSMARNSLLRARDFRLVAGAVGVSALGDWVAIVALGLQLKDMTGSGFAVAGLWICLFGPSVAVAGYAGLLVDTDRGHSPAGRRLAAGGVGRRRTRLHDRDGAPFHPHGAAGPRLRDPSTG